jgi:cyclopropane fatty-acyl-phospholipid synthase-like methyltransferase
MTPRAAGARAGARASNVHHATNAVVTESPAAGGRRGLGAPARLRSAGTGAAGVAGDLMGGERCRGLAGRPTAAIAARWPVLGGRLIRPGGSSDGVVRPVGGETSGRRGCEMAARPAWTAGWTAQHVRHAAGVLKQGGNPAARVYESIGPDFFLAVAPGWLNLGLWEGPGSEREAEQACRRLVATLASALPAGGVILDVGNGLGTQDRLIAETARPRRLVAVNITEWQLTAGRDRLRHAAAAPVAGDAARLPIAGQTVDGIISVEAAFHFRSRKAFFAECYRVLRPGGVLSISDISAQRGPVTPAELLAGLTQLRVFGLRRTMAITAGQIAAEARAAGLAEVQVRRCGDRVIAPALRLTAERLKSTTAAPAGQHAAARLLLWQVNLLWQRQIIDYLLLRAIRP